MSKKEKLAEFSVGLADALDKIAPAPKAQPKSAAGRLMGFANEQAAYEEKITALEAKIRDLETTEIPVALIAPNPWQPRRVFDDAEIDKLTASIAELGLIQPIVVRSVGIPNTPDGGVESVGNPNTHYQLIAGERRLRVHQRLGRDNIRAVVLDVADEDMAAFALAENVDRADLTAYEIAVAIRNAESSFPSRKSLANALGINRSDLYSYLAFFKLPDFILDDLDKEPGLLGRDAAKAISVSLEAGGEAAAKALEKLWPRIKSGDLEQGRAQEMINTAVLQKTPVKMERDIKKLFVGNEQAGSITRDAAGLSIKIRAAALTPENEAELKSFVERLFNKN